MRMRRNLPGEDANSLLAALRMNLRNSQLHRVCNMAMPCLMFKTWLRTIERSRARIEHFQELVLDQKRRRTIKNPVGVSNWIL